MRNLYLLIFCVLIGHVAYSQCDNSIALKKATFSRNDLKSGVIELEVNSSKAFTCTLNSQLGQGVEKIQEKGAQRGATIKFEGLDPRIIYQVVVEFKGEEKPFCNKLQKSQITLQ